MPFKSKAQRRKFAELLVEGKISPEVYEEWNRETGRAKLPERVGRKARAQPRRRSKRSSKVKAGSRGARRSGRKTPRRRSGS